MDGVSTIDLKLIAYLLDSPRASYAELARHTGVSETTAKRRVEALIEHGVISPAMIPDVRRLGFGTMALVGIKVDLEHVNETAEAIGALPQVTSIHVTLGRYDLMATLASRTVRDLADLITDRLAVLPGVRDVETFMSVRSVKILHNWRLPAADDESGEADADAVQEVVE